MADPDETAVDAAQVLNDGLGDAPQCPAPTDASEARARCPADLGWSEEQVAEARATWAALRDVWDDPDLDVYNDL